jgi:hypothetical protein
MKRRIGKDGRITYVYSHSVSKGGNVYLQKTINQEIIKNKEGLRSVLQAIVRKYQLIDANIKIYDEVFFFFFHLPKGVSAGNIIDTIQQNIVNKERWDEEYVFTGVYDLQEHHVKEYLEKHGFEYEEG